MAETTIRFHDRRDAGQRLAAELKARAPENPVVLALPRGGVPVGFEVAQALGAPLDVLLVGKIGAPGYEEFGIGEHRAASVQDRTAIIVDDGIATGATVLVALRALANAAPKHTIVAVPVAPPEAVAKLSTEADEIVCLSVPPEFRAVNMHYQDFTQTSDDEVIELLAARRR